MLDLNEVFAWTAIGLGAGMAGNLWHARRDGTGVALKLVAAPIGAVIAGCIAALWIPHGRASMRLFDAAAGGIAALALLHWVWALVHGHGGPQELDLERDPPGTKITAKPTSPGGR
jgi:uncharacterized membrane protein YeaQ/YmgE (transglycosylase-associated protein family)